MCIEEFTLQFLKVRWADRGSKVDLVWMFKPVWFPNCGTRRPSRWYANRSTFYFSSQKCIHSKSFYLSGPVNKPLNFCAAYVFYWFQKMVIINFSVPFFSCCICVNSGFSNLWSNDICQIKFSGTKWYVVTVRDLQTVRDQKTFVNHWLKPSKPIPTKEQTTKPARGHAEIFLLRNGHPKQRQPYRTWIVQKRADT